MPVPPAPGRALREKFSVTASEMPDRPPSSEGEYSVYPPARPIRPEGPPRPSGRSLPHFGSTDSLARQESSDAFSFGGEEEDAEPVEWEELLCRPPRPEAPSQGDSDSEAPGVSLPPVPRTPQERLQIC